MIQNLAMELLICFFLLSGAVFCFGGSLGLLRFPDSYCKMQALSKPVTIGIFNFVIAYILFLYYSGVGVSLTGLLTVIFILLTAPIGSHMMAKSAYKNGEPMWDGSVKDDLHDQHESDAPEL